MLHDEYFSLKSRFYKNFQLYPCDKVNIVVLKILNNSTKEKKQSPILLFNNAKKKKKKIR